MTILRNLIVCGLMSFLAYAVVLAQDYPQKDSPEATWIQNDRLFVVVPRNQKCVTIFSIERNEWSKIEFDIELAPQAKPIVYEDMVALKNGRYIFAYSAKTGTWDKLTLEGESEAVPTLTKDCIHVRHKDTFYVFGIHSTSWTAVSLVTGDRVDIPKKPQDNPNAASSR